jgi:nucleoside-diphosphate-sugar epimerase
MLSHVNVGSGTDISILDLARLVARVTKFEGEIVTDTTKPDGTPRKLMDVSRLRELGWEAQISLEEGIAATYQWFLSNSADLRGSV